MLADTTATTAATRMPILAALYVGLLGVLLSSFPARSVDPWQYLAAGRDVLHGHLGPTWLYDLVSYAIYSVAGGVGLVAAKALICGAAAVLVFQLSRAQGGWWIPLVVTGLAVLAMANRLLLQPATVSLLFLALAFWLIRRKGARSPGLDGVWPGVWLVGLFVIWGNVDEWVVLGLAVVALTWLGQMLDARPRGGLDSALGRWLGRFAVLIGATCLNPSHVHALHVPATLQTAVAALWGAPDTQPFNSPFSRDYFIAFRSSPAALAFYPLFGLGLLSLVLNRTGWRWAWFLPWVAVAAVSSFQSRTIPLFAVVAGPVLAWNLQVVFARRDLLPAVRPRVRYAAWAFALVLAAVFIVCAWPGWLQGPPYEPRRWVVEQPVAIRHAAEFLRKGHAAGLWAPGTRTLHVSADTRGAFAWFCPEDEGTRDAEALADLPRPDDLQDWHRDRTRLRERRVNRVVISAADVASHPLLQRLSADPEEWPLLHVTGGVLVFGWRDPFTRGQVDPFRGWELDFTRLAFRPDEAETAPAAGPGPLAVRHWWDAFCMPAPPQPPGRDEAAFLLMKAEVLRQVAPVRHREEWEATQAAAVLGSLGGCAGPGGPIDVALRLSLWYPPPPVVGPSGSELPPPITRVAREVVRQFVVDRGDVPVGVYYAAIRAARRAVTENPYDANSYLLLGRAYLQLGDTVERKWAGRLPQFLKLRQIQASAALNRAVALNPKLAEAHYQLALLYRDPRLACLDLALFHLRTYRDLTAGRDRSQNGVRGTEVTDAQIAALTKEVDARNRSFDRQSAQTSVSQRATLSVGLGLGGKAREILLGSDISAFGEEGTQLEIQLLLRTGRPDDVLKWLEDAPDVRDLFGDVAYHWVRAQALAAVGDYDAADARLAAMLGPAGRPRPVSLVGAEVGGLVGKVLLDQQPGGFSLWRVVWGALSQADMLAHGVGLGDELGRQCDMMVIRGLLALEAGNIDRAGEAFRGALSFAPDRIDGGQLEFNGRPIAWEGLDLIDSVKNP